MSIKTEQDAKHHLYNLVKAVKSGMRGRFLPKYSGIDDPTAKYLEIDLVEKPLPFGDGGQYFPTNPKPVIAMDPASGDREKLNFTYFHEVCHHLIKKDDELYEFLDEHAGDNLHPVIERFCDLGAAEFLIPQNDVQDHFRKSGFSIRMLAEFDKLYPASKPAILIQMAQNAINQCILVICKYGSLSYKNQQQKQMWETANNAHPQLFIQYSSSSPSCKYQTGRGVPIAKEHFLTGVFHDRAFKTGRDKIPFRTKTEWIVPCEGLYYEGKVYAAFHITDPNSFNQPKLL